MGLLAEAQAWAADGYRVIPLSPSGNKRPLIDAWTQRASADPEHIRAWWKAWPDANIGLLTGGGWCVIDLDAGGEATLAALESDLGYLPDTLTVRTGGGGRHLYYGLPDGVRIGTQARQLGEGVDVRGDGGQVQAPPSMHPSGRRYVVEVARPRAILPDAWVARLASPAVSSHTTTDWRLEDGELIPEGERDHRLYRMAASMRGAGFDEPSIVAALLDTNARRVRPPLPERTVAEKARSACRKPPGRPSPEPERRSGGLVWGEADVTPAPAFPLHALPVEAACLAREFGAANGCPADMVAVPALSILGAAVGGSVRFHLRSDWRDVRPAIWTAICARPGSGKSPALRIVKAPLARENRARIREHRAAMSEWDAAPAKERGERPRERRLIADDTTFEKLDEMLADNPRGVLWLKDEVASLVTALNQYRDAGRGADRQKLLSLWSGDDILVDRKYGGFQVDMPTVSVTGGIQPALLDVLAGDDGIWSRFLIASFPAVGALRDTDDDVSADTVRHWDTLVTQLLGRREAAVVELTMSPEGRAAWREVRNGYADRIDDRDTPEHMRELLSKMPEHVARLTCLLRALPCLLSGAPPVVDPPVIHAAAEVGEYFLAQAAMMPRPEVNLLVAPALRGLDAAVDRLVAFLRARGGFVTRADVLAARIGGCRTDDEVDRLLARAAMCGTANVSESGGVWLR